ncbi:MAG: beta-galactosidase trimerization domain-containing protein [Candidatus Omnitrophica bacterium]|nr:beta-galactosidase trimerization domain-containing protein [Candidatus Omnitrophota bacterium]
MKKVFLKISIFLFIFSSLIFCQQKKNPEKIYLRFKVFSSDSIYAYLKTVIHRSPWSVSYSTIPRGGQNYPKVRIRLNNYSPWTEISGTWGTIVLDFRNPEPLENIDVEIQLSTKDDESGIFKTMRIQEKGNIVAISLPPNYYENPDNILTVRQESEKHLKMAQSLNLSQENLPKKFSFYTGADGYGGLYKDIEIWKNELKTLKTLGINGTYYPGNQQQYDVYKEIGFDRFVTHNPGSVNQAKNEKKVSEEAFSKIQAVLLADEPGNYGLYKLSELPAEDFHRFLESKGLKPKDFNAKDWSDIKTITDRKEIEKIEFNWGPKYADAARKAYYWTHRYAQHITINYFKNMTDALEKEYNPGVLTFVNYTDHPLILGGVMCPGSPDWFEMGLNRATTLMWTEDWMYGSINSWGNGLYQRLGFLCDILRSATSRHNQILGFYNTMDGEEGIRMKGFIVIAHGVKIIDYFYYGPTYSATENYWSDSISQYKGVAKVIRDIGKAEELVYPGKPVERNIAIVYSTTSEIWDSNGAKGHEKQYLHIALAQEMYPADVINETLIEEKNLSKYKVIYLMDTHLPISTQKKLKEFVEKGGTLVLFPFAAERDEYDNSTNILTSMLDLKTKVKIISDIEKTKISLNLTPEIVFEDDVYITYRKAEVSEKISGKIIGSFPDGSPAILQKKVKKGNIIYYTFMPGHNFFNHIKELNKEGNVTNFPEKARKIISIPCITTNLQRNIEISAGHFEAGLLESEKGFALIMVNLGRKPIEKLDIKVKVQGIKNIESIENGAIEFRKEKDYLSFSMPFNSLTDILLLWK